MLGWPTRLMRAADIGVLQMVAGCGIEGDTNEELEKTFSTMWSTDFPFSVRAFVWRCFLNKVPTKDQLSRRCISLPNSDSNCVFFSEVHEILNHFLFFCP